MKNEQRQRIINRHRDALKRYGYHHNSLYWSSREIQELRFQVLCDIGIEQDSTILDVGCGFGDLYQYLRNNGFTVEYTGIDLSPDLIEKGSELNPEVILYCGDLFDFSPLPESYDYVFLSGALSEPMNDGGDYAKRVIERCYQICRKGVAFNMLNKNNQWIATRSDLQSFKPETVCDWMKELGISCSQRDDYLDNDFTTYIYK